MSEGAGGTLPALTRGVGFSLEGGPFPEAAWLDRPAIAATLGRTAAFAGGSDGGALVTAAAAVAEAFVRESREDSLPDLEVESLVELEPSCHEVESMAEVSVALAPTSVTRAIGWSSGASWNCSGGSRGSRRDVRMAGVKGGLADVAREAGDSPGGSIGGKGTAKELPTAHASASRNMSADCIGRTATVGKGQLMTGLRQRAFKPEGVVA